MPMRLRILTTGSIGIPCLVVGLVSMGWPTMCITTAVLIHGWPWEPTSVTVSCLRCFIRRTVTTGNGRPTIRWGTMVRVLVLILRVTIPMWFAVTVSASGSRAMVTSG